ncbi:MAG: ACP S-malonyltransferase [Eggerthellaceae bacterium]|jgi:[acyl-carrier-protein] S-malonyltransferase|nr:ACP S-malonyltransferase [Eggerthellaceae bacterium]MCH4221516.1 ACP S-malonyltransferase [Eggerthellaceae bacterium]
MKAAFVFAGQGSQKQGMGLDLYERYPLFKQAFDCADPDGRARRLCFDAPLEELSDTRNLQPAMVAFEVALTALLADKGIIPSMTAGLSLGEYSALCAAHVFEPAQAVKLAAFRGAAMADAVKDRACGMVAVLGLERAAVETVCQRVTALNNGVVEPANYNCPWQIVISGDKRAVDEAAQEALDAGAKRCIPLPVSGAFHTSLMNPAAKALHQRFETESFAEMSIPVIFNSTARPLESDTSIAQMLEFQVAHSVYFEDTIHYFASQGIDTIVEVGPGRTLSKFVRKTEPDITTMNVGDVPSLTKTIEKWEMKCHG